MKIVITDSGLGGLSVCAEIESMVEESKSNQKLELIYFNSLPDNGFGYNNMKDDEVKAEVFNSALNNIESKFNPDKILIACNTLSVVFDKTNFSQTSKTNVVGIVDFGVEMVLKEFRNNPKALILLLGTPTTINSMTYQNKLIEDLIPTEKIVGQACPLLETKIQEDPFSNEVEELILKYVEEAKSKTMCRFDKVIVLLACTHYGYSLKTFNNVLEKVFNSEITICNPNQSMSKSVVDLNNKHGKSCEIKVKLFSQADISMIEKNSIGGLIKDKSPRTYKALMNSTIDKQLFPFSKDEKQT